MRIESVTLSGFRCFGPDPITVLISSEITAVVGPNAAGKTALLQALSKLFGVSRTQRTVQRSDFHLGSEDDPDDREPKDLLFRRGDVDVQADSMTLSGRMQLDWSGSTLAICFAVSGTFSVNAGSESSSLVHAGDTFVYDNIDTAASCLAVEATTPYAEFLLFRVSIRQGSSVRPVGNMAFSL